jgi:predicted NAD-dependent protein-ADP-ribosyltransferase YbiA (DUF1768 family)
MTYAGIGSRETPQDVLDIMTKAATYLESLGYTLRSGGAAGADTAFEKGVKSKKQIFGGFEETGEKEKKVAHEIHPDLKGTMNRSKNRKIKEKLAEGATQKQAEKSGERSAWAVENLMARNTNQVFGENLDTPVDFVLAYDKSGWTGAGDRPSKGGTLQAIDMAYRKGIPVINMANDNWREQLKEVLKNKPAIQSTSEIKGIEINSKQKGLGNDLTNVHYARNGKSAFDIVPTDKSLKLTPEAKKTWGESTEAWYQSNKAQTKGIPEGPEEDAYDMKLMIGLITDKLKQYSNLVNEINERGGQAFLDKSTHTMGNGRWSSNNPKNMFMNALKQAYQNVTTQPAAEVKIEPTDKIIWGHPGLGKTFLRESRQDIIDFDSDYKPEINKKYNLEPGYKARNEWRKTHENEWNQMVRELWREAKQEAKKTGKTLLASDMIFLREFASDIDKIITMSTPTFIERSKQRDDYKKGDTEDWKNKIDIEISKMPSQKVITTDKYLSDLLPKAQTTEINLTPEQIKLAKEKKIEQNFYDKKPYAREKDSTGKVTKWDVYKSKNGKSSMQAALDGDRTQSTRSVSEIQKLEELAKSQGITSGIKGTIVWMEGQVDNVKDSKNIKGDWFRITSEPYTPNKKDFDAYENWDPSVWENRSSEFKMGEKGEWKSIRFERVKSAQPTTQPSTLPGPETKINIYAGTGENAELSNFAVRPFREYPESTGSPSPIFKTVEGAYQATKLHHTDKEAGYLVKDAGYIKLTPKGEELTKKLQEATGAEAERLGRSITGLKTDIWDFQSHIYMKRLIKKSFEQNPDALAKLLATGNATLTHTQDKGKWRTEFPRLLMEVRDELRAAQPSPQPAATAPEKTTKPEPSGKVNLGDSQYSNKDLPDDLDIIDSKIFTDYFGYDEKTKAWTPMQGTVIGYRAIQDGYGSPAISLKVKLDNDRIYTTIMHYGRYWEKFGWNVDDRLKAGYDKYVQLLKNKPAEKPVAEPLPNDKYQYYGAMYEIVRDSNGVGIDVVGYQGKAAKKEALLTAYNNNPNIDPQNDKPFREVEGPKSEQKAFDTPAPDNNLPVFTYEGKTITTDFQLTDQQDNALKQLIDFVENDTEKVITLSGYAGTGKTSMIKYLEKFLPKSNYKFIYSAPTHAATVYLALSTGVFPFTVPQLIRGKYNPKTNQTEYAPSKKFEEALSIHKDNILVIDEASMIGNKEISQLLAGIPEGVKVIFMGDEAQIPEVGMKGQTKKNISKVFTDFRNIQLTDVKRTNDNGILKVLTEIRNNPDGVLPVVPDTETLKYYDNAVTFKKAAFNAIKENPEGAVYISYVNSDVKDFNRQVREGLGYEGDLKEGEVITGYAGYNSKTVLDKNLGNSIKYTVDKVTVSPKGKEGEVIIDFSSKLLEKIPYLVEKKATKGTTRYLQLSPNDALIFEGITDEQMLENNRKVAEIIEEVYDAKVDALRRPAAWRRFYDVVYEAGKKLAKMDLGNQYIYNPSTRLMELYIGSPKQLEILGPKGDFKELLIDRGIDYGYGITIHKSQGATYENVFYNGSSVNNQTPLIKNNVQVGTEGNSLNYVGMSRASKTLSVLKGQYTKDLSKPKPQVEVAKQPVKPTVTSAATTPIAPTPATRPAVTPEAASKLDKRKKIILRSWQDAKMAIILAEKGYDINDFIAKLGAAQTDAEINEIINKLNRLLC